MYTVKSYEYSVTLSGTSIVPYRTALYDHFDNASDSLWELDPGVSNQSSTNFVIRQKGAEGRFQIAFSPGADTTQTNIVIDKGNGITDAEDPTQGSLSLFNFGTVMRTPILSGSPRGLSSNIFITETNDSVTLLPKLYTSGARFVMHVGDIIKPLYGNDSSYGFDGLGYVGNLLCGSTGALTSTISGTQASNMSLTRFKVSHDAVAANCGTDYDISPRIPTTSELQIGGRVEPAFIPMCIPGASTTSGQTKLRHVGDLKYIKAWTNNVSDNQIISDTDAEQAFICMINHRVRTAAANDEPAYTLFPWEYGKQVINL
jgi:hypothetical protein